MTRYFARKKLFYLQMLLSLDLFSGCASYRYPTENYEKPPPSSISQEEFILYETYQQEASSHWLYRVIPRHRSQMHWYDLGHWCTWALFGNDDAGIFSEAQYPLFKPNQSIGFCKALFWMFRNPLHNFCFYVVGSAACPNDELTILKINGKQFECCRYDPEAHTVFGGRYTSFYFGFHNGKPLISLRIAYGSKWKSDFYIGWRERGNFGIKFLPLTKNSLAVWENHED